MTNTGDPSYNNSQGTDPDSAAREVVDQMIRWLRANGQEAAKCRRGHIRFVWEGRKVNVAISRFEDVKG